MNPSDPMEHVSRPRPLSPGDTIAVAAPASPFDRQKFDRGIAVLKSCGFQLRIPDEIYSADRYLAGTDIQRAGLINTMVADPDVKAVICARGGFGSMKLLPLIDWDQCRANPKIIVGFSDATALICALYERCALVTFHGPMVTSLADATDQSVEALVMAISSGRRIEIVAKRPAVVKSGRGCGPVIGGNLATLCHLVGTGFSPCFKSHILLLEERGEAAYRIDRMLTQMKMARCFDGVAGVVLGSFEGCGSMKQILDVVDRVFQHEDIPIVSGFDIGHGRDNLTVPIGLEAVLDADRHSLVFAEPATE